jgi:hypothetical protein
MLSFNLMHMHSGFMDKPSPPRYNIIMKLRENGHDMENASDNSDFFL